MSTEPIPSETIVPSLNKIGYMLPHLTEFDEAFLDHCKQAGGPVLEIGTAFGTMTLQIANEGVQIYANDLDPQHLAQLSVKATPKQKDHIELAPGRFPQDLEFKENTFTGVLASNIFHYLRPPEVELGIEKMASWLKPGGKAVVVAGTPYASIWREFIPTFEENVHEGKGWPGYIDDFEMFKNNLRFSQTPDFMHFLSPGVLEKKFRKYGLETQQVEYCTRSSLPQDLQWDGRENVGIIAVKTK